VSNDSLMLVTGSEDGTAKLWETKTGRCIETMEHKGLPVIAVAIDPLGQVIITSDGTA